VPRHTTVRSIRASLYALSIAALIAAGVACAHASAAEQSPADADAALDGAWATATPPAESPEPEATESPEPERAANPTATPVPRPLAPQPVRQAVAVSRGVGTRRAVALTFDAGADRGYAEQILDILLYAGVKASFGMTGVWAQQNPDLVQRMALEGHRLINHTYDHSSFTGYSTNRGPLSAAQRRLELDRVEAIVNDLTGESTRPLFRSPYGDTDAGVLRDIASAGYAYNVLWTVDSRGWMGYSAGAIIERCLRLAEPGAIYVFHVGGSAQDGPALPAIITGLRDAGYDFETVDAILTE
jgi:peptidoglycan/xylan/chitin deacetylase (PgdA/CDA1 family)